jgi:hypothetical protein
MVERGKRGEEVFTTVINLPPGQLHDSIEAQIELVFIKY